MTRGSLVIIGGIMVVLGIVAVTIPSFTYFTRERVGNVGFYGVDVSRPHTVVFNPIVGCLMLIAGCALVVAGRRSTSAT